MSLERIVHQDAPQIGMSLENDPEHVEAFALEPIRRAPHSDHAVAPTASAPSTPNLDADAMAAGQRVELIDDVEARLAFEPIDGGQIGQKIEFEIRLVAQRAEKIVGAFAIDGESFLVALILRAENFGAEACFDFFCQHRSLSPSRARRAAMRTASPTTRIAMKMSASTKPNIPR